MIRINNAGAFDRVRVEEEVVRLRSLVVDLEKMLRDGPPTASDLADAPILEGWDFALHPVICLDGTVSGHPDLRDGCTARTSEVIVMDSGRTKIRTLSRWYRLGQENLEYVRTGREVH